MKTYQSNKDFLLLFLPVVIFCVGLFFIYSASWREGQVLDKSLVFRQAMWMVLALGLTFFSLRVHYRRLLDITWAFYGVILVCLVIVLFTPARLGAHRWIHFGFFNFQPSELAKIAVILALASFMRERPFNLNRGRWWVPFVIVGIPVLLTLKEPDLGTGMLFLPLLLSMMYVWGFRFKWIFFMVAAALISSPLLYHRLADYQKSRLLIFLNPDTDPLGAGYTIIQSKIAMGSGGLFGKGFMSGSQTQLKFLPEKHTDFIFSVIGEEGGFIATSFVILCYWLMIYRGFKIAQNCNNPYGRLIATGITTILAFQAIVNMFMTVGLLPVVGMPLMLVSYGGSSLIVTMLLVGLLINIGMRKDPFL